MFCSCRKTDLAVWDSHQASWEPTILSMSDWTPEKCAEVTILTCLLYSTGNIDFLCMFWYFHFLQDCVKRKECFSRVNFFMKVTNVRVFGNKTILGMQFSPTAQKREGINWNAQFAQRAIWSGVLAWANVSASNKIAVLHFLLAVAVNPTWRSYWSKDKGKVVCKQTNVNNFVGCTPCNNAIFLHVFVEHVPSEKLMLLNSTRYDIQANSASG